MCLTNLDLQPHALPTSAYLKVTYSLISFLKVGGTREFAETTSASAQKGQGKSPDALAESALHAFGRPVLEPLTSASIAFPVTLPGFPGQPLDLEGLTRRSAILCPTLKGLIAIPAQMTIRSGPCTPLGLLIKAARPVPLAAPEIRRASATDLLGMDVSQEFGALLEAAGLERPEHLSAALEIPVEVARHYAAQSDSPPRAVVLAVERLIDVRVAAQITMLLRHQPV